MLLHYLKMLGAGNRILVVDARGRGVRPPSARAVRRLADTSTGPGFDQLMWVTAVDDPSIDAGYRIFNANGSEVGQCGNGVRCVASALAQDAAPRREFRFQSPTGIVAAVLRPDEQVTVSMGAPEFEPAKIPFVADTQADIYVLQVADTDFDVSVLSMGNPHCVLQVADVDTADVGRLGPAIESHARFPERTNVGFMAIRSPDTIDLRVYERGVGETRACGTGACAAVVTGQRMGKLSYDVAADLPGGQLVVSWPGTGTVWLTGNVEFVSEGTIDL